MPAEDKAEILAAIAASERRTMAELSRLDGALRGTLDGDPGLLARMKAIEAAEARRDRIVCAAVVAVLGAIGHTLWQIITHRPTP